MIKERLSALWTVARTWAKREFNPRTIRSWWVWQCAAPFIAVNSIIWAWVSAGKILSAVNMFFGGALLALWHNSFMFQSYRKICADYKDICAEYRAELEKLHTAFQISQTMLEAAQMELAKRGVFMKNVQVRVWPAEPPDDAPAS